MDNKIPDGVFKFRRVLLLLLFFFLRFKPRGRVNKFVLDGGNSVGAYRKYGAAVHFGTPIRAHTRLKTVGKAHALVFNAGAVYVVVTRYYGLC